MPTQALITSYKKDMALFPDFWHRVGVAVGTVLLLAYPFVADDQWLTIGNLALVTVVGALGMMLLTGFSGQLSLGHAGFLAVGAYATAILSERFGMPFWLSMPIAGLSATAVGIVVGPFALRLKGLYLAIVTLGLLFLINHTLHSMQEYTHGAMGIAIAPHAWFPEDGDNSYAKFAESVEWMGLGFSYERKLFFVFLAVTLIAVLGAANIQRSNTGRAMMAVRDHDVAAAVMGVHPAKAKIVSFGLSSFYAGVAGSMFAIQQQYITIEPPFDLNMSVSYIAIIVLGGMGTVFGAVWGAVVFVALSPLAESFFETLKPIVPLLSGLSATQQATLLFSVLVVAFLIFEPLGLLGLWLRVKRYFMAWPFRY